MIKITNPEKILRSILINDIKYTLKQTIKSIRKGYVERELIDFLLYESLDGEQLIIKRNKEY